MLPAIVLMVLCVFRIEDQERASITIAAMADINIDSAASPGFSIMRMFSAFAKDLHILAAAASNTFQ